MQSLTRNNYMAQYDWAVNKLKLQRAVNYVSQKNNGEVKEEEVKARYIELLGQVIEPTVVDLSATEETKTEKPTKKAKSAKAE